MVLEGEIGGCLSSETSSFLTSLACAKAREGPASMQGSSQAAWRRRWASMLSLCACALSLLELRESLGADGDVPNVHEVVGD